ncbi:MAG: PqqD family protein [Anaerolineae bacterium]|nr:PqqD family protein [Candidatus Roseilinea sp.]MDW8449509.1 PqqD family protein [Anaerolineae bacterium]
MEANSYRVNTPHVVYESFADEVIAVSFLDGSYYSIRGAGIEIWKLLCTGASVDRIAAQLQRAYPDEPSVREAVSNFLQKLLNHSLITTTEESATSSLPDTPPNPAGFAPPILEAYTDMQDLMLLDPIHEVGEDGWPQRAAVPSSAGANE